MNFEETLANLVTTLKIPPQPLATPEEDALRRTRYETDQADKLALLRGLRNQMTAECERFNAAYRLAPPPSLLSEAAPATTTPTATVTTTNPMQAKREQLRLTEIEWSVLHAQAEYNMQSVANHISVIVRKHLGTIQKRIHTTPTATTPPRPVGRPPAPPPAMTLQPWTPAIWEDELESWHAAALERNAKHPPATVRVAHDLYIETLFAHLQRVGFPHPFKAGFTAI